MASPPANDPKKSAYVAFDDDIDGRTVVDSSQWKQPKIPEYPAMTRFDRFEVLGRIGRGGMAEVFLVRERADDGPRHTVLKRVLPEMQHHPELLAMFLQEGKTAVRLFHPNVCHVYECGEFDGVAFMNLEWVYGPSLQDVVKRAKQRTGGPMPWPIAAEIVAQIASALQYVHHAKDVTGQPLNIVHRDVSPHNVMLSWGGAVKLLDFGIAKRGGQEQSSSGAGKYGYMSPEQAQSKRVDPRSDLFALGIVLYEALTGEALYDRSTVFETLDAIINEPPRSARAKNPAVPEELDAIVKRALAKTPEERFDNADRMKGALRRVLRGQGHAVQETFIAEFLGTIFDESDKEPLKPNQRQITGSFRSLSEAQAENVLQNDVDVEFDSFAHEPSVPPIDVGLPSDPPPRARTGWVIAGLLTLIAAAAAAGAWLLQSQ